MKRGKSETYLDKDEDKDAYLLNEGVEAVRISVFDQEAKKDAEKELSKAQVKQFCDAMIELFAVSRIITRKGISLETYLEARDEKGRYPVGMAIIEDAPKFAYTKEEYAQLDPDVSRNGSSKNSKGGEGDDMFSEEDVEQDADLSKEDETEAEVQKIDLYEFPESREVDAIVRALEKMGFSMNHFDMDHFGRAELTDETSPYRVYSKDNTMHPAYSLVEVLEKVKDIGQKGFTVQRYKGLGEMNADQLWETTMDPQRRRLLRVTMEDAIEAETMFTTLMGDEVVPRRAFIQRHAPEVRNLDV